MYHVFWGSNISAIEKKIYDFLSWHVSLNGDFYLIFLCQYATVDILLIRFLYREANRGLNVTVGLRYCTVSLDIWPRRNEALSSGPNSPHISQLVHHIVPISRARARRFSLRRGGDGQTSHAFYDVLLNRRFIYTRVRARLRSVNSTPISRKSRRGAAGPEPACHYPAAICRSISWSPRISIVYIFAKYVISLPLQLYFQPARHTTRCTRRRIALIVAKK